MTEQSELNKIADEVIDLLSKHNLTKEECGLVVSNLLSYYGE